MKTCDDDELTNRLNSLQTHIVVRVSDTHFEDDNEGKIVLQKPRTEGFPLVGHGATGDVGIGEVAILEGVDQAPVDEITETRFGITKGNTVPIRISNPCRFLLGVRWYESMHRLSQYMPSILQKLLRFTPRIFRFNSVG